MSQQYRGLPANISRPGSLNIVSSTNASPIVLTVTAHGLTTGDVVDVANHTTNTAANGRWAATVIDANDFALYTIGGSASRGNGVGGATGTVQPRTFGASFAMPSDGDAENAASVDVSLQALADRTEFAALSIAAGSFCMIGYSHQTLDPATGFGQWGAGSLTTTASQITLVPSGSAFWTIPGVNMEDLLEIDFGFSAQAGGANSLLFLEYDGRVPGGVPGIGTKLNGTTRPVSTASSYGGAIHMKAFLPITASNFFGAGNSGGNVDISLWGVTTTSTDTVSLDGAYDLAVKIWRPQ